MAKAMCQQALDRVIAYLRGYGVEPTHDVCRKALRLIDSAMDEGGEQLIARAIDRIPEYFELPDLEVPPQRPDLMRSSIGYHRDV